MKTPRGVARAVVGIGALVLSESLVRAGCAQNPPIPTPPPPPAIASGVIVDSAGLPIRHAVLSVVGESLRVATDSTGHFRLLVPPGPRLLAARALGYRPLMWSVGLVSGVESSGVIRLQQLSIVLPEMTVVGERYVPSRLAGFYHRQQSGFGKYLDPEYIARRWSVLSTADFLNGIAGVRVSHADPLTPTVGFMRCASGGGVIAAPPPTPEPSDRWVQMGNTMVRIPGSAPLPVGGTAGGTGSARSAVGVYVDGFKVLGDPGEALSMINPADVEAIEVYRGVSELPAEFMSDDCAAIVIWTKY